MVLPSLRKEHRFWAKSKLGSSYDSIATSASDASKFEDPHDTAPTRPSEPIKITDELN
ncbi:hypothetical protein H5410_036776 [Solanum commersonii]|uniref:Uncharacterized protein n=1 Tax=Solanum commersonii TaxID=4109 RepID=A0A9J5Y7J3_SOLCO|nr:hypothetical protein H5410_036776 [Solanum commersonii]